MNSLNSLIRSLISALNGTEYSPQAEITIGRWKGWSKRSAGLRLWMLATLAFSYARLQRFGYDPARHALGRISKGDRLKLQILVVLALALFVFVPVGNQYVVRHRTIESPETGDYFDDLMRDTLARQRVEVLKTKMDSILIVAPDGTRRNMSRFDSLDKAYFVIMLALSGDCSYEHMNDEADNPADWRYEGVTLTSASWYEVWDSDVETLLRGDSVAFGPLLRAIRKDKTLSPRMIEEFDLIDYFSPKKVAKNKTKAKPKMRTASKPATQKAPELKPGRKTGGGKKYRSREEYIRAFAPVAMQIMHEKGVPASITLGQAIIEGSAGTSVLAVNANNHFGIKWRESIHGGRYKWYARHDDCCKSKKCKNPDKFVYFPTVLECYRYRAAMLARGRYARIGASKPVSWSSIPRDERGLNSDDKDEWGRAVANWHIKSKRWAYGLDAVGYATKKTYSEELLGAIGAYDLDRFNR